jgi:hypothetical protein
MAELVWELRRWQSQPGFRIPGARQADLRIQPGVPPRIPLASAELILLPQREQKLERPPVHGREVRRDRDRHDGGVRDSVVQRNLA